MADGEGVAELVGEAVAEPLGLLVGEADTEPVGVGVRVEVGV